MNHGKLITLQRKPDPGIIPRGLSCVIQARRNPESLRVFRLIETWQVSAGDLLQAHKLHVKSARYWTNVGVPSNAARALRDAEAVRQLLTRRKQINTLDILRGRA